MTGEINKYIYKRKGKSIKWAIERSDQERKYDEIKWQRKGEQWSVSTLSIVHKTELVGIICIDIIYTFIH